MTPEAKTYKEMGTGACTHTHTQTQASISGHMQIHVHKRREEPSLPVPLRACPVSSPQATTGRGVEGTSGASHHCWSVHVVSSLRIGGNLGAREGLDSPLVMWLVWAKPGRLPGPESAQRMSSHTISRSPHNPQLQTSALF